MRPCAGPHSRGHWELVEALPSDSTADACLVVTQPPGHLDHLVVETLSPGSALTRWGTLGSLRHSPGLGFPIFSGGNDGCLPQGCCEGPWVTVGRPQNGASNPLLHPAAVLWFQRHRFALTVNQPVIICRRDIAVKPFLGSSPSGNTSQAPNLYLWVVY